MKYIDLTGQQFGRLTVLSLYSLGRGTQRHAYWLCKCECGNKTVVGSSSLRNAHTRSCQCLVIDKTTPVKVKWAGGEI